jgi:hypothetical protein
MLRDVIAPPYAALLKFRRAAMRRFVACLLLLMTCAVAHASGRHENWDAVRKLQPGVPILVQGGQGQPEFCSFVSADDAALTCNRIPDPDANWTAASKARLVLPRTEVLDLWRWQEDHGLTAGQWVLVGLVAAWEIGCSVAGGAAGFLIATLVAGVVALAVESTPFPMEPPPPQPPRMRRRLLYRAPQLPAGSVATP